MNERGLWYRTGDWGDGEAADTVGTIFVKMRGEEKDATESTPDDDETVETLTSPQRSRPLTVAGNKKQIRIIDVSDEEDTI